MAPPLAGRSGKILARFPSFMRAPTPGKALAAVASALGGDLDEGERLAMRIQQAHRLQAAPEERDLEGLAATCDLHPADFALLDSLHAHHYFDGQLPALPPGAPPRSDLDTAQQAYGLFLDRLRSNIARAVAVLFEGCGTIWSLLEGSAILMDADRLPDNTARAVQHLDDGLPHGGFVHRVAIQYHTWQATPSPGAPTSTKGWVYLVENPLADHSTDDTPRHQGETFRAHRGGFFDGQVTVQITGTGDRTVHPLVINETDHEGFYFADVVPDGQQLVFTTGGKATLNGTDVTARAVFLTGALVATGAARDSRFAPTLRPAPAPDASPDDVADVVTPAGGLDRAFPRPALTPPASLPALDLRLGDSTWRFSVEEGAYDLSAYDQAVYAFPVDQAPRMALPPSGKVQLTWKENTPFAVSVLVPADARSLETAGLVQDLPSLVRGGLERYRTAGIRLDVSYFDQAWLLGHSVLTTVDNSPPP
jgi:hypothetical protein